MGINQVRASVDRGPDCGIAENWLHVRARFGVVNALWRDRRRQKGLSREAERLIERGRCDRSAWANEVISGGDELTGCV